MITPECFKTKNIKISNKGFNVFIEQEEKLIKKEAKKYMNKKQHKIIVKKVIKHLSHYVKTNAEYKAADAETKKEIIDQHFNYLFTNYKNLKWLSLRDKEAITEEYLSNLLKNIGTHFNLI